MRKEDLDKRICDVEENAVNEVTYRTFIEITECAFGLGSANLDNMSDSQLTKYLEFMDELWDK